MRNSSMKPAEPLAVDVTGLIHHYGSFIALKGIDLHIGQGQIFGLLGPNGAGKSTALKIMTTLLTPTAGRVQVSGINVVESPCRVREKIGYVPQMLSADGALTGYENLRLSARLYDIRGQDREQRINEALQFMGMSEAATKQVKTYSGGMIRRLELAQSMLHRPTVLFLDEPTIGLDPVARRIVWERLLELRHRYGITILITTHDMEEADYLCDELAILHQGAITAVGTPVSLKAQVGPEADLNDVFSHFSSGGTLTEEGGGYRDVRKTRTTARRLG